MSDRNRPQYRIVSVHRNGVPLGDVPDAVLGSARWELNSPGFIKYTIGQNSRNIHHALENITEAQLWVGDNLMHWGFHHQTDETPQTISYTCPGLLQYANFRFVVAGHGDRRYGYVWNRRKRKWELSSSGVEQLDIAAGQWSSLMQGFYIGVARYRKSGVKRFRTYDYSDHKNLLTDIMSEWPDQVNANGDHTGFDFDIIYGAASRSIAFYYPRKGRRRDDIVLEWGKNITDYASTIDGSRMANFVIVTGQSNGDTKKEAIYPTQRNGSTPWSRFTGGSYSRWYSIQNMSDQPDVNTLAHHAKRYVQSHSHPLPTLDITVVETSDTLLGRIHTGDSIRVIIKNGRTNVNSFYRIQAIEWFPGPGNLKLELADQVSDDI